MTPDFGDIKGILVVVFRLFFRHDLNVHRPSGEIPFFDRVKQVLTMILPVRAVDSGGFLIGKVFDALLGLKMEFAPNPLVVFIVKREGMLAEEMHIAERGRNTPVAHHNGDLMEALGKLSLIHI